MAVPTTRDDHEPADVERWAQAGLITARQAAQLSQFMHAERAAAASRASTVVEPLRRPLVQLATALGAVLAGTGIVWLVLALLQGQGPVPRLVTFVGLWLGFAAVGELLRAWRFAMSWVEVSRTLTVASFTAGVYAAQAVWGVSPSWPMPLTVALVGGLAYGVATRSVVVLTAVSGAAVVWCLEWMAEFQAATFLVTAVLTVAACYGVVAQILSRRNHPFARMLQFIVMALTIGGLVSALGSEHVRDASGLRLRDWAVVALCAMVCAAALAYTYRQACRTATGWAHGVNPWRLLEVLAPSLLAFALLFLQLASRTFADEDPANAYREISMYDVVHVSIVLVLCVAVCGWYVAFGVALKRPLITGIGVVALLISVVVQATAITHSMKHRALLVLMSGVLLAAGAWWVQRGPYPVRLLSGKAIDSHG